jgi:hypothetical protein
MLENPELFYKMNRMSLKEHKNILNQNLDEKDPTKSKTNMKVPPCYFKKIKIYKMNLFMTLKSDYFYGLAVYSYNIELR